MSLPMENGLMTLNLKRIGDVDPKYQVSPSKRPNYDYRRNRMINNLPSYQNESFI